MPPLPSARRRAARAGHRSRAESDELHRVARRRTPSRWRRWRRTSAPVRFICSGRSRGSSASRRAHIRTRCVRSGFAATCGPASRSPARCTTPAMDRAAACTSRRRQGAGMTPAAVSRAARRARRSHSRLSIRRSAACSSRAREKGLCSVKLGDRDEELEQRSAERVSVGDDPTASTAPFGEWVRALVAHRRWPRAEGRSAGRRQGDGVPMEGVALPAVDSVRRDACLQRRRRGPRGAAATRAVARACATNHVCLVIPCHRVVQKDGGLGGYRWGIERKRRLLQKEKQ